MFLNIPPTICLVFPNIPPTICLVFPNIPPTICLARNHVLTRFDFLPSISLVVYWETHILTKYKSTISEGPKVLVAEIQAQINLFSGTNELRALQQNCYFAHLENLLLAMLGDEDKTVRAKAVNVIQKTRYAEKGNHEENETQYENFIHQGVTLQQHHALIY